MTSLGVPQVENETPSMVGSLQAMVQAALLQMHTCLPGIIESYDSVLGTVNVQPSIKRKYIKDDEVVNLPIINSVPICFPRAGQAAVTLPIKKGDTVLLVFSQRSLDNWKTTGGIVEAGDPRHHDLSDAFAIPGVYPSSSPLIGVDPDNLVLMNGVANKVTVKSDGIEIKTGAGLINVGSDGKVELGNGVVGLLDILDKVIDEIIKITVPTGVGPSGIPVNGALFTALKAQLGAIKG